MTASTPRTTPESIKDTFSQKGTMMSSTQDLDGRRPSTIQRQLVRTASSNVHASEERDDAHYSFLQVKKGYVLLTRMESITAYKNQHGQHRSGTQEQPDTHVSANDMCALDEWPSHARRNRAQPMLIEEQARAIAANQQQNSKLSQQVNELQDQLQTERANTQERINLVRAEREQLEERLKKERAERERLLEEERTSRLEFEKKHDGKVCRIEPTDGNPTGAYEED